MRILIASPLYPPDIAEPAPYTKECARRLGNHHSVTVLTYGSFPEKIPGVRIVHTSKRRPLPIRLFAFTFLLFREALGTDVIYAQNGASVELPATIVSLLTNTPLYAHLADQGAHEHAQKSFLLRAIEKFFFSRAKVIIEYQKLTHPEILPFRPTPEADLERFERTWHDHILTLEKTFQP